MMKAHVQYLEFLVKDKTNGNLGQSEVSELVKSILLTLKDSISFQNEMREFFKQQKECEDYLDADKFWS